MIKQLALLPIYILSCLNGPKTTQPNQLPQLKMELNLEKDQDGTKTYITSKYIQVNQQITYQDQEEIYRTSSNQATAGNNDTFLVATAITRTTTQWYDEEYGEENVYATETIYFLTINVYMTTNYNLKTINSEMTNTQNEPTIKTLKMSLLKTNEIPTISTQQNESMLNQYNNIEKEELINITENSQNNIIEGTTNKTLSQQTTKTLMIYLRNENPASQVEQNQRLYINNIALELETFTQPVTINTTIIDIPGLMFEILSMPFAFISQAFNLTLFPGTPYQINIANTLLVFIAILVFAAILKIVLKIFM